MTVTYDASRVTLVDRPLVQHKLSILRDKNTGTNQFRRARARTRAFDGCEAMRDLCLWKTSRSETPSLPPRSNSSPARNSPSCPSCVRAFGMVDGILDLVPSRSRGPTSAWSGQGYPRAA